MKKIRQLQPKDIEIVELEMIENILEDRKNKLSFWEKAMETKELIEVEFPFRDENGDLYCYFDKVCVKLPVHEVLGAGDAFVENVDLQSKYSVCVIGVKENLVLTSYLQATEGPRTSLIKNINTMISAGKYIRTQAKVIGFAGKSERAATLGLPTICLVDIAGCGIMGFIRLEEWSVDYTNKFQYVVQKGQIINLVILNKQMWRTGVMYECSRRLAMTNDPMDVAERMIPKGTAIKVRCVDVRGTDAFIGKVIGVDDISVFCSIKDEDGFTPVLGEYYAGVVHKINRAKTMNKRSGSIYVDILKKID